MRAGNAAKPEIWTDRADFDAAFKALADATKTIGEDAKTGDADKVKADWTVLKSLRRLPRRPRGIGRKIPFAQAKITRRRGAPAPIAAQIRCGVAGMSRWRML